MSYRRLPLILAVVVALAGTLVAAILHPVPQMILGFIAKLILVVGMFTARRMSRLDLNKAQPRLTAAVYVTVVLAAVWATGAVLPIVPAPSRAIADAIGSLIMLGFLAAWTHLCLLVGERRLRRRLRAQAGRHPLGAFLDWRP